MPYIDSNVFIYPAIYRAEAQPKAKKAKEILMKIEDRELRASTSTLTWDEVTSVVSRVQMTERAKAENCSASQTWSS